MARAIRELVILCAGSAGSTSEDISMDHLSKPLVIEQLSLAERILVVEQIWDSIAAERASLPVTPAQQEELDRRLAAYRDSPAKGSSWDEVKARLQGKK